MWAGLTPKDTMYFNNTVKEGTINILGSGAKQLFLLYTVAIQMYYLMPIPLVFSITHNVSIPCHSVKAFEAIEGG